MSESKEPTPPEDSVSLADVLKTLPLKSGQQRLYMVQASDYAGWGCGQQFPMRIATRETLADMVERCAVDIAEWERKALKDGERSPPNSLQVRVSILELEVAV